jgi:outer membrane receptor protein involved in Fe transport
MVKKLFSIVVFALIASTSFSQNKSIKGTLKDSLTNEDLIGAVVYIKDTKINAYSQLDGTFKISVPDEFKQGTLVIKLLSYKTIERQINESDFTTPLNINLKSDNNLQEVVVSEKVDKESAQAALNREKSADNVVTVMSSRTIQLSPDITVANNLQRMSGIVVDRNSSGEGHYAIIRGMDKRYSYTMINGIKIPSPDNKNRYVPMDIFPSEIVQRLEVTKALTPNMEGDAIGGAMNVILKDAPDNFVLSANAAGGMSQLLMNRSFETYNTSVQNTNSPAQVNGSNYQSTPSNFSMNVFDYKQVKVPVNSLFGLTVGNRFFKDKKFGIILSGTMQNIYKGANSVFFNPDAPTATASASNVPVFSDMELRTYSTQTRRIGADTKMDYRFNSRHKITLSGVYLSLLEVQQRHIVDSVLDIQRTGPGSGNVSIKDRSMTTQQNIYNGTLFGEHHFFADLLKVNWTGAYSLATSNTPDWADFSTSHAVVAGVESSPNIISSMSRRWMQNTDRDYTGKLDLTYSPKIFGLPIDFSAGGLYRNKNRTNYFNEYDFTPTLNTSSPNQTFTTFSNANMTLTNPQGNSVSNGDTYNSMENITAAYAQAKFRPIKKLLVFGGVRMENTYQSYVSTLPATELGQYGHRSYTDFLPSFHLKYELTPKQNLRASYFASIARPSFFEMIPYSIPGDYYTEIGNPYLKHTQADNYDLRWEYYPKANEQVLVGLFYKNIYNPIEWALVQTGVSSQALQPNNYGTATNFGAEFLYSKFFLKNFGVSANYTYTHSSITTSRLIYYENTAVSPAQFTSKETTETRPLQGQAANIANLSLLFKAPKPGITAQVALVYTGTRIVQLSPYAGLDFWQAPFYQLDASAEKKLGKHFTVYAKVNNITNTPYQVYINQANPFMSGKSELSYQNDPNKILVRRDYYKQTYLVGLRYKF